MDKIRCGPCVPCYVILPACRVENFPTKNRFWAKGQVPNMQERLLHIRKCTRCGETKPIEDFYRADKKSERRRGECKVCTVKDKQKHYAANSEYIKHRLKKYYADNPEKYKEKRKREDAYHKANRDKANLSSRKWKAKYYDKINMRKRLKKYNTTEEEINQILKEQNYCCAICGLSEKELGKKLHIDHNHNTGVIRGMLCGNCNRAIGLFKENIDIILNAKTYLELIESKKF